MTAGVIADESPHAEKMEARKTVVLWHFWGDIEVEKEIDADKKLQLHENYNVVVANGKYIIRKKKNPNTHGKYPYIFIPCIIVPFRFWPIGIIEPIRSTLDYMDDIQNMMLDGMKFDLMNMYGIDFDSLEDPDNDLIIEPGNFVKFKGGMQSVKDSITSLRQANTPVQAAVAVISYLDRIVQLASGVVDPLMGMVTKGEQTATEFRGSLSQSTIKFESIARDIEEFSLNPAIEMIYQLIWQNMDSGMWMEITGEDGLPMQEYISPERIEGNYDFYAGIITGYLAQLDYIGKLVATWSTMIQSAQIMQITPEEARKAFKKVCQAQGVTDINDIISDKPTTPVLPPGVGGGTGLGEPPTKSPNPNLGPENVMQALTKSSITGGM